MRPLEEAIFFAATGSREERGPVTVEPRSDDLSFRLSEDQLDDNARRPLWRLKRIFDVVLAAVLGVPFVAVHFRRRYSRRRSCLSTRRFLAATDGRRRIPDPRL